MKSDRFYAAGLGLSVSSPDETLFNKPFNPNRIIAEWKKYSMRWVSLAGTTNAALRAAEIELEAARRELSRSRRGDG